MRHILLLILISISAVSVAQTKTWDGGAATNSFSDAANWNPDGVPGPSDEIEIGFGNTVDLLSGNYTLKHVELSGYNSVFTIHEGAQLNVVGSTNIGFEGSGSQSQIVNRGTLQISNTGHFGLSIYGVFTNDSTGTIAITNAGDYGIVTGSNDTLYNYGSITITTPGNHGIYNTGTVTNYTSGTIEINGSNSYGFNNGSSDFLNNYGTLTVNGAANFGLQNSGILTNYPGGTISLRNGAEVGLRNSSKVYNQAGATIEIFSTGDAYSEYGLLNDNNDSLFNAGLIHITQAADDGIYNNGYIQNESTGIIQVDSSGQDHPGHGIYLLSGQPVVNAGTVIITGSSDHGILNEATLTNQAGGTITINNAGSSGIFNSTADLIDNEGMIMITGAQSFGIRNYGHVLNGTQGTMVFQQTAAEAIRNEFQDLVENLGSITVFTATAPGLFNLGTIELKGSGILEIFD